MYVLLPMYHAHSLSLTQLCRSWLYPAAFPNTSIQENSRFPYIIPHYQLWPGVNS